MAVPQYDIKGITARLDRMAAANITVIAGASPGDYAGTREGGRLRHLLQCGGESGAGKE